MSNIEASEQTCALCQRLKPLCESHLVPRFYFQRMRREGPGRYRRPLSPNRVEQDGPKATLLCVDCEQRFSRSEGCFASDFFHPWMDSRTHPETHGPETHYFLISLLWRRLVLFLRAPPAIPAEWKTRLGAVAEDWRLYLHGDRIAPECDHVHLMLLDVGVPGPLPIANLNRYMAGTVDLTVAFGPNSCLVYAKMGLFLVLGLVDGFDEAQFINTRITSAGGQYRTPSRIEDGRIGALITDRARESHERLQAGLSEPQREAIRRSAAENIEQLVNGIHGRALLADLAAGVDPLIGRSTRVGRNEKCPCGSGVKFKRCHGAA